MSWWSRLHNALDPRRLDDSLDDEIQDHLQHRVASLRALGVPEMEARRRALAAFGNVTRIREESRDIRMWAGLDATVQDLRYAWRTLRRSPSFTLTAVLSLSLAIGSNTAIYSIIDAALLRPLPVPDAARVFTLMAPVLDPVAGGGAGQSDSFSYPLFLKLRAAAADGARLAAFGPVDRADAQRGDPASPVARVRQQFVSGDAFDMLHVSPVVGRLFSRADDETPGEPRLAVLSFDYWREQFDADPGVVGRSLMLDGRQWQIAGVASRGFSGVEPGRFVDVWLPLTAFDPGVFSNPEASLFRIVGRLADTISAEQLEARLRGPYRDRQEALIARHATLPAAVLSAFAEQHLRVRPGGVGASDLQRSFARPMLIVWAVSAAVLLVACANVASLMLSRSAARAAEMSLRTSLGANRGRLLRQLLAESLLLSGLGSVSGLLFANALGPGLVKWLSPENDPVRLALAMDRRVLLFSAVVCVATTLLVGALPAWHGSRPRPLSALTPGGGEARRLVLGRVFVGIQVAFVFCLLVAGTGFVVSLHRLSAVETGFDARHVAVLTMRSDYGPEQAGLTATQQLQEQLAVRPGVAGAAVAWLPIFGDTRRSEQIVLDHKVASERQETFYRISPRYFSTMKIALLQGRDFDIRDTDGGQPIPTIVNGAFARRYFRTEAVVGREFERRSDNARHIIIGVAADAYYSDLRGGVQPIAYFPMKPPRFFTLYVRSTLDPASVKRVVEQEARRLGPALHVIEVTTLEGAIGNTLLKEKLLAGVGGVFAALGLVLVAIGLFGLLSYSVACRGKELALRAALGAGRHALISLVLNELWIVMAGGLGFGLLGALVLMRGVHSQLFAVATVDPVVITTVTLALVGTTSLAVVVPAYRAATIDPLSALRRD